MTFRLLTLAFCTLLLTGNASAQTPHPGEERPDDRAIGEVDAPIRMVEYASVACPHCRSWYETVWPMVQDEFISTGEMRFIYREMLTGQPQLAAIGFMIADCAPDDQYFNALHLLFETQTEIFGLVQEQQSSAPVYYRVANALGLSEEEADACIEDEAMQQRVLARHQQSVEDGAGGTPAFFINNYLLTTDPTPDGLAYVYHVDGEPLMLDGDLVPSTHDADTFRRIILYLAYEHGEDTGE
ncbi:thioredoxin domain-containing protein [Hyphobacterium sp. CCMP332]|jgi:protein-disulfide isomerase|uniref:thioredoxin domain-containing protein n=1 Tax=Hyphobacterium sp. CCMP332 TaxID=2749086 RepID=UPI00165052A9|nr:thioredoxin domain-containing protein [Hyphobacterium sp. CCMP332]QNL19248.1 thioredoxin domain-containing protein [Hyphobacterium sp. CCMP332]